MVGVAFDGSVCLDRPANQVCAFELGFHNVQDGFGMGDEMGNERQQMFVVGWVTNAWGGHM